MASEKIKELLVPSAICIQLDAPDSKTVVEALRIASLKLVSFIPVFHRLRLSVNPGCPPVFPGGKYNAAIPHTDIEHVIKPALALATLKQPVNFQNMIEPETAVPVQLVIVMALEQAKTQVEMLQEIAGVLQDEIIIEKLMNAV